jgi:Flp pilus assembly secretin CpaC
LFSQTREQTRTGIPLLMDIPLLGALFGNSTWTHDETELLILVTPTVINPNAPPPSQVLRILPDTSLPARGAIEKRLPPQPPVRRP